jgi:hypothetical protein
MRKGRINVLNKEYITAYYLNIYKETKVFYPIKIMIKYFINN